MKHITWYRVLVISYLVLLPGCGRIIDWGMCQVVQAEKDPLLSDIPCQYLRSIIVYDQLNTSGIFDALWLSDDVKTAYTDIYMAKNGKSEERAMAFLRRQLEENRHFITFYILVPYRIVLGDPDSIWSLYLGVDGTLYTPTEIKVVDLDIVYQSFFGKRFNQFKVAYRVKFDAQDADEQLIINTETRRMTLFIRSLCKEISLNWDIASNGKVIFEFDEGCPVACDCYEGAV